MSRLVIVEDRSGKTGFNPRGGAIDLWRYKGSEAILSGPAETGKTYACCQKIHAFLLKYPGSQGVMLRKQYAWLVGGALDTYAKKVLLPDCGVEPFGGERPSWFDYPNGSRLWVGGLDKASKVLSSERDIIYVNQAEELTIEDWQTLTTRATGRAGNSPYAQVIGDCNPGPPHHWIKHRESLRVFESRHEDNPTLYTADGKLTEQGRRTMAVLDALTGVRKERLRHGRWVSAEGTVYQFDASVHLVNPFAIPVSWVRFRSIDFGFTNPFVCQWWAMDPDGRLYLYREVYLTGRTVGQHAETIKRLSAGERYEATVADHDREDRETLHLLGIPTLPARKQLSPGIQAVETRLARALDGKPRLFVVRGCLVERDEDLLAKRLPVCTEQEFDVYSWPKSPDGKPVKEAPVDKDNHGMDALRYAVMWADARQRSGAQTVNVPPKDRRDMMSRAPGGVFSH